MPYCDKCGKYISGSDDRGLCADCSESESFYMPGEVPKVRVRRNYSLYDSGITFSIIFALLFLGVLILQWLMNN